MHSWTGVTVGKKRSPLNRSEKSETLISSTAKDFLLFQPIQSVGLQRFVLTSRGTSRETTSLPWAFASPWPVRVCGIRLLLVPRFDCPARTIGPISANLRQPTAATVYKRGFFGRWHNVMRADSEIRLKEVCPKLLSAKSEEADRVKAELRVILAEYTREKAAAAKLN
jgi:hypothetical protein